MNKSEQDLRQQLRSEADEILFNDLHFDNRLKERVIRSVNAEEDRTGAIKRFRHRSKIWLYSTVAAATIVGLLLLSSSTGLHNMLLPLIKEKANIPSTFHNGASDNLHHSTFMGGENTGNNDLPESLPMKTKSVKTLEEAKKLFGAGLLVPSYTPEHFNLKEIQAYRFQNGSFTKVIFSYVSSEHSFVVIEDKNSAPFEFHQYETIESNGVEGYLKSDNTEHHQTLTEHTELHWFADDIHYSIIGNISHSEAIKVWKSIIK